MSQRDPLPDHVIGEHYRVENPEIEVFGLRGRIDGNLLYLQDGDEEWHQATPSEIFKIPMAIHRALGKDYRDGIVDQVGKIIVPRLGGITLPFVGIIRSQNLKVEGISEDESYVDIHGVDLRLGIEVARASRFLDIRIDPLQDEDVVQTALADGTRI